MKLFHFFDSYFENLAQHPDRADMLLLWTICTMFIWFWMVRLRVAILEGMAKEGTQQGETPSWETREIIIFFSLMAYFPVAFFLVFLTEFKVWGAAAIILPVWYQIFGRFIFDWILAFKGGLSEVPEHETKVKTEVKVETETK